MCVAILLLFPSFHKNNVAIVDTCVNSFFSGEDVIEYTESRILKSINIYNINIK